MAGQHSWVAFIDLDEYLVVMEGCAFVMFLSQVVTDVGQSRPALSQRCEHLTYLAWHKGQFDFCACPLVYHFITDYT